MGALKQFFHTVAALVFHMGGPGLLLVGVIDSSFLTAALANDLLIIVLTASHPGRMPYYAAMAALGSTIGCAIVDVLSRKAEKGVKHSIASRRLNFVESHVRKRAGAALAVSAIIPPPFPFTPFVIAAAVAGYPRKKLLSVVAGARLFRFAAEGALAIFYGEGILSLAKSRGMETTIVVLIIVALGASAFSIFRWIRGGRKPVEARSRTRAERA